jgi:hypothetical protein
LFRREAGGQLPQDSQERIFIFLFHNSTTQ